MEKDLKFTKETTYDIRFMEQVLCAAKRRVNRGEFPVACVLVCNGKIIADCSMKKVKVRHSSEGDHAEITAIRKIKPLIRKNRVNPDDITCYVTLEPCLMCFGALLIAGIKRLVFAYEDVMGGGTGCDLTKLPPLYRNLNPEIIPHVLRTESLELFKKFWEIQGNHYLRGTLLHEYTISQPEQGLVM